MPEIRKIPEIRVAYVEERGPFDRVVPMGFERLFGWLREHNQRPAGNSLAVFYDDPAKVPAEDQRADTCVPIGPNVEANGEVHTKTVGGGEFATTIYQGRQAREHAYNEVYDWLKAEGYKDSGAPIETFLSQLGEELRAEIAVPVEKAKRTGRKTAATGEGGTVAKRPRRKSKTVGTE